MKTLNLILIFAALVLSGMSGQSIAQWSYQNNPLGPGVDLGKIQFVTDQEGWISAGNGSLLHTTDGGTTWNVVTPFPNDTIFVLSDPSVSMWWMDANHGWIIGSAGNNFYNAHGGVLYVTINGGASWYRAASGNPYEIGVQVQFVNDTVGWISAFNLLTHQGSIFKSTDGGSDWNPTASQPPSGGLFYFVDANNGWGVNNSGIAQPPYGIIKTTDGGNSWTPIYGDTTAYGFNALQFLDVNNGYVIGRNTTQILKTTDGGSTWTKVYVPSSVGKCGRTLFFLNSDTGWVAVSMQDGTPAIIFTSDGGKTWSVESIPSPTNAGDIFSIYFRDLKNGWFTQEQCVQNCNGPDSLHVYAGLIGHTTNNGGLTRVVDPGNVIKSFRLHQNYPNPFNPSTVISFEVPVRSHVKLSLYDVLGREVKVLVDEYKESGNHFVSLNASDLSSGIYFYHFMATPLDEESKIYSESRKLVVLK
jgi:photosystem II stability/assembly factor-like uncharacterized protein